MVNDHDLLIRIDEAVRNLKDELKHMANRHEDDYSKLAESVKQQIHSSIQPVLEQAKENANQISHIKENYPTKEEMLAGDEIGKNIANTLQKFGIGALLLLVTLVIILAAMLKQSGYQIPFV